MKGKNLCMLVLLCIAGTAANFGLSRLAGILSHGLYLDTVLTIGVTFSGGLAAGLITAVLSTAAYGIAGSYAWIINLFGLCNIASALLTWLFIRGFPGECAPLRIIPAGFASGDKAGKNKTEEKLPLIGRSGAFIMLLLLSVSLWILISVLGGLIAVFIELRFQTPLLDAPPETYFKLGLLRQGLGLAPAAIMARLPVNIVDRFISVFAAYGSALLLKKALSR